MYATTFENGDTISSYMATGIAEGFEEPEHPKDVYNAWSFLIGTGLAYRLQGSFGRQAHAMIEGGLMEPDGTIIWENLICKEEVWTN